MDNDKKKGIVDAKGMKAWFANEGKGGIWVIHNATCHNKPADIQKAIDTDQACARFRQNVQKAIEVFQAEIKTEQASQPKTVPDFAKMTPAEFRDWQKAQKKA